MIMLLYDIIISLRPDRDTDQAEVYSAMPIAETAPPICSDPFILLCPVCLIAFKSHNSVPANARCLSTYTPSRLLAVRE